MMNAIPDPYSILLITDSSDVAARETLRDIFEPAGYQTILAESGEHAIDIVRRQDVHLALMDMYLPRLSGLETMEIVRQMRGDPRHPALGRQRRHPHASRPLGAGLLRAHQAREPPCGHPRREPGAREVLLIRADRRRWSDPVETGPLARPAAPGASVDWATPHDRPLDRAFPRRGSAEVEDPPRLARADRLRQPGRPRDSRFRARRLRRGRAALVRHGRDHRDHLPPTLSRGSTLHEDRGRPSDAFGDVRATVDHGGSTPARDRIRPARHVRQRGLDCASARSWPMLDATRASLRAISDRRSASRRLCEAGLGYHDRPWPVRYSGAIMAASPRKERISAFKMRLYGFHQVKIKVGVEGQDDPARMATLRKILGRRMDIRIDANEAWAARDVVDRVRPLLPFRPSALEQPVPHAEVDALADLRPKLGVPVMLDESLCGYFRRGAGRRGEDGRHSQRSPVEVRRDRPVAADHEPGPTGRPGRSARLPSWRDGPALGGREARRRERRRHPLPRRVLRSPHPGEEPDPRGHHVRLRPRPRKAPGRAGARRDGRPRAPWMQDDRSAHKEVHFG